MTDRLQGSSNGPTVDEERLKRAVREAMAEFYRSPPQVATGDQDTVAADAQLVGYPGQATIEEIQSAISQILDKVRSIATHVGQTLPKKISGAITTLERTVQPSPFLAGLVADAGDIEKQLQKSFDDEISAKLKAGLSQLEEMITLVHLLQQEFDYIERRFKYALNSFASLNKILNKGSVAPTPLQSLEELVVARSGSDAGKALLGLAEYALVHANPVITLALAIVHGGGGGVWSQLFPYSLAPGDLDAWINEEKIEPDERDFRRELVAAIDHYCRGKFGAQDFKGVLRAADQREAIQTLVDLTSVLFSTLFGYILRHPNLPSPTLPKLDWAHPFGGKVRHDDQAAEFSISFSRHFAYQIKSVIGLCARGFWAVSPNNDALVECVSSIATNLFSSLIESFLHNLLWSVEIHETYGEKSTAAIWRWDTREEVESGGVLTYQVYVRPGVLSEIEATALKELFKREQAEVLKKLLKDYGAYADALRPYRAVDMPEATKDVVAIDAIGGGATGAVKVSAKSTYPATFPSLPVLRAYCNGVARVMKKAGTEKANQQLYECTFTPSDEFELSKGDTIHVRSNYGGAGSQVFS